MTSFGVICGVAAMALGIWLVRADRDHAWRKPAMLALGVLTVCAVTGWIWDSSYAPAPAKAVPATASAPTGTSHTLARPLMGMCALLLAAAVAFFPSRQPAPRIGRVLVLTLLLYGSLAFMALVVWWVPWHTGNFAMWLGCSIVSSIGIRRHGPSFTLPWGTGQEYEHGSDAADQ